MHKTSYEQKWSHFSNVQLYDSAQRLNNYVEKIRKKMTNIQISSTDLGLHHHEALNDLFFMYIKNI